MRPGTQQHNIIPSNWASHPESDVGAKWPVAMVYGFELEHLIIVKYCQYEDHSIDDPDLPHVASFSTFINWHAG